MAVVIENFSLRFTSAVNELPNVHIALSTVQFVMTLILVIANLTIPRRPDVYRNEKIVDRQNTGSFLGKITFNWPAPLLNFAAKHRGLGYDDLHDIDYQMRSKTLRERFNAVGKQSKLWKAIVLSHKSAFVQQYVFEAITCFTNFLPQVALYFILRALEARDAGEKVTFQLWSCVLVLGVSTTSSLWLESWLFFIVFMKIGVPVYEQLSAVIFGKAIRRKDVKGGGKKKDNQGQENLDANGSLDRNHPPSKQDRDDNVDDDEDVRKTRQSTINLVGVDSKRSECQFLPQPHQVTPSSLLLLSVLCLDPV